MRDWLSANELAALNLPGMPSTKRAWLEYAERDGWFACQEKLRPRSGRGGGFEFHIDLLPSPARAAYVARYTGQVALQPEYARAIGEAENRALSLAAQESRDARLTILSAVDRLARDGGLSHRQADLLFVAHYNRGRIDVEPWVREFAPTVSAPTLARWRKIKRFDGVSRLGVDKGAARRSKGKLESGEEGKVRAFLLSAIATYPHWTSDHLRELTIASFPAVENVSLRSFQRLRKRLEREHKVLLTKVTNPDAYKSKYRLTGQHPAAERLNELWMIDASPADVLCVDGRHSVYLCIDSFSRRLIVYVSKTPRAEAVALLMRRAILAWGVPERVKTDNGSDFTAKSTQRLFGALDIEVELSAPFSPEQKGMIERAVRTFQHDLPRLMPGFIGHSVADRKVIESRRAFSQRLGLDDAGAFKPQYEGAELQAICDDWAIGRYANRPHSGLNGVTPSAKAASWQGAIRRVEDVHALDMLLAPIVGGDGLRTVTKKGVRIDHSLYITPTVLPETRVFVRMDPEDMGRAWLFSEDGAEFLGEAICPHLAGIDPAAAVMEARALQKQFLAEQEANLRAGMRAIKKIDAVDVIVRQKARDAGKLVEFPKPSETYTTPGLQAARAAIDETPSSSPAPIETAAPEPDANVASVTQLPETRHHRYRYARDLEARLENNERLSSEEINWLISYKTGIEYRTMAEAYEEFGESALR